MIPAVSGSDIVDTTLASEQVLGKREKEHGYFDLRYLQNYELFLTYRNEEVKLNIRKASSFLIKSLDDDVIRQSSFFPFL